MVKYRVSPKTIPIRADIFVASKYPQFSRSSLEDLFEKNLVSINEQPVKAGQKLKAGEVVNIDERLLRQKPSKLDLPITYDDDNVLVINKPAGVLTHSKGALNQEATVASFIVDKLNDPALQGNRAGIVHRLDRATSGVIITAKNQAALKHLQKQFSQRRTKKTYVAILAGSPKEVEAIIDAPVERNPKRPQTFRVGANGKSAVTRYKVIKTFKSAGQTLSLVELYPLTGRTHQIRVHMAYIGTPVLGDRVYGEDKPHMYLHAKSLEITIPGGERRTFSADLPEYFKEFTDAPGH